MRCKSLFIISILLFSLFVPKSVIAVSHCSSDGGFSVSPVTLDLQMNPGDTITKEFEIFNESNNDKNFKVYASPFSETDRGKDFATESNYTLLSKWISFSGLNIDNQINVSACDVRKITLHITVPENALAGGQYAAVFVESKNSDKDENKTQISPSSRIGILLYGHVHGDGAVVKDMAFSNEEISLDQGKVKAFCVGINNGNIDGNVEGHLVIRTLFGEKVYDRTSSITLLPGVSNRELSIVWDGTPMLGIFTAEYTITTTSGATKTLSRFFILIPVPVIIILVALIVLIIYRIIRRRRRRIELI